MHDWTSQEAEAAAVKRHTLILEAHVGFPESDGHRLVILCACGLRCPMEPPLEQPKAMGGWQAHLTAVVESTKE